MTYRKFESLTLISLTREQHEKTCGYWYLVQELCSSHTAFRTAAALFRWLEDRGLEMTKELPAHGEHSYQEIKGSYGKRYLGDRLSISESAVEDMLMVLDNAEYTIGYVTHEDGICVVNIVSRGNPRVTFDYATARAYEDRGMPGFPGAAVYAATA